MSHRLVPLIALALLSCKGGDHEHENAPPPQPNATEPGPSTTKLASPDPALRARAKELANKYIIVDGHIDVPYRLGASKNDKGEITEDISKRTEKGDFDYPRARAGGLDAPFMSIYVPAKYQKDGGAKKFADSLIDMVMSFEKKWPDKFKIARSPAEVRSNFGKGLISLPMGMENGAPIGDDLKNIAYFYERGIRYITLTHSKDNLISDSSYDTSATWKGLSPFGRKVVEEMNRVGIMIDISHVSDNSFYQVLDITKVPVIASHSSARQFTVDFERNMSDEMIEAIKENGGVVMINFGSTFINDESRRYFDRQRNAMMAYAWKKKIPRDDPKMKEFVKEWVKGNPPKFATVKDVADHIDRVVKFAGVDHVGFGSDFDGVGDSLPVGLKDVSQYPNLIAELLARGYSETDIEKMASGNLLRVWAAVENHAKKGFNTPGPKGPVPEVRTD
ncbi:MAG: dipeptidase [Deltaproteobacteria bacterium]|nr:dipeptidase [Deltaproteobacteria bacterium]